MKSFKCFQSTRSVWLIWPALLCVGLFSLNAYAQQGSSSSSSVAHSVELTDNVESTSSSAASSSADSDVEDDSDDSWRDERWHSRDRHRNELVGVGHDVTLRAGERASSVVGILGSISSEGEVSGDVVSVAGDARVIGPVGHDVVSVLGNVYINNTVGHDVIVTMGSVKLGPQAVINGRLVTTGSAVSRDPGAVVQRGAVDSSFGHKIGFEWLRPWIDNCLKYGRPLAIAPGLGWAWLLALWSLLSYVLTGLLAPRAVDRCITTLETSPGYSLLAALLTTLASPILFVLLAITVIGIAAIPFLGIAMLCVGFFGKLVMLAWLGRRVTRGLNTATPAHTAFVTLIGGVIVTGLYLVPIFGFVLYKLLGFIGFGVVIYTLILTFKSRRQHGQQGTTDASSPPHVSSESADGVAADAAAASSAGATTETTHQPASIDLVSLPRATFWPRMGALLLDVALVAFMLNLIIHLDDILLLTVAVYGAVMWKLKGTTIGGILFNLRVVRLDGRELDWPTAIVRALSCFLSLIALGLGFIWIALDPERQAWHDKIAGTVVVKTPKGVSLV